MPSPGAPLSLKSHVHPAGNSSNRVLLGFYRGFLKYSQLIKSVDIGDDSVSSPSPLSGGQGDGAESSKPPITRLVPLATSIHS